MLKNPLDTQSRVHFKAGEHLFSQDKASALVCSTNLQKKTWKSLQRKDLLSLAIFKAGHKNCCSDLCGMTFHARLLTHTCLYNKYVFSTKENKLELFTRPRWVSADTFQQHLRAQTPEEWSKEFLCVLQLGLAFRADKNTARNTNIWYNTSQHGKQPRQTLLEIKLDWGSKAGEKQSQVWTQKAFQLKVIGTLAM